MQNLFIITSLITWLLGVTTDITFLLISAIITIIMMIQYREEYKC